MYKTIIGASLIAIACFGCKVGPTNHYEIDINPAFDSEHQGIIVQASQKWVDMVADPYQLTFDVKISECQNGDDVICVFPSTSEVLNAMSAETGNPESNVLGVSTHSGEDYLKRRSQIYLAMDKLSDNPTLFYRSVSHEFGHSLGGGHLKPDTIMCANVDCQATDLTCEDINQFLSMRDTFTRDCRVKVGITP